MFTFKFLGIVIQSQKNVVIFNIWRFRAFECFSCSSISKLLMFQIHYSVHSWSKSRIRNLFLNRHGWIFNTFSYMEYIFNNNSTKLGFKFHKHIGAITCWKSWTSHISKTNIIVEDLSSTVKFNASQFTEAYGFLK
jgi:hypothetical protein